jgi:LPXTG-motif cell wall-anchored protein
MEKETIKYVYIGIVDVVLGIGGYVIYKKIKKHAISKNKLKVKFVRD